MAKGYQKFTTWIAGLGALVLLAVPASGALVLPHVHPIVTPYGLHFRPVLPVSESIAWALVALGFSLFLLLRAQAIQATIPLAPARLAQSSQWQLLATGNRSSEEIIRIKGV